MDHVCNVLGIQLSQSFAWTDSTIVLHWLEGNPRRFKTYVGNRASSIVELLGPDRWRHIAGMENPADCASRGLFPSELIDHKLWWEGPEWLKFPSTQWPNQSPLPSVPEEEKEISLITIMKPTEPLIPIKQFSSFTHLKRVTAWILRFINNRRSGQQKISDSHLNVSELQKAEVYWVAIIQSQQFAQEVNNLSKGCALRKSSPLILLQPFLDKDKLIRVGGREKNSNRAYSARHPIIIHGSHPIARLIMRSEHLRLLHAGQTLLSCSLHRRFHIIGGHKAIRSITRGCVVCRRMAAKPQTQMMGQVPVTPEPIFSQ